MKSILHPARSVALVFLVTILIGMALLMLPAARAGAEPTPMMVAFFTSVAAVCVTGMTVVDTGTYWSLFGQWVIMVLFQLGGFGMMTAATLLGLMVNRSTRLRTRLMTQTETRQLGMGDVANVARVVLIVTIVCQLAVMAVLSLRLHFGYDLPWSSALWSGLFHAVSAFNNAGFSIHPDSLTRYAADGWILAPVMLAILLGGIGFPVLQDLREQVRDPRHWSLHTKLTLYGSAILLVLGSFAILFFEWDNMRTLGAMGWADRLLSSFFMSVAARTAGFNTVDIAALTQETWALHYLLMFIGGGSASTAGGVKVGTVAVLALLVIAEAKGRRDTEAFGRRVGASAQRQAITVLVLGSMVVAVATLILLHMTELPIGQVIFEVIAAFSTAGLQVGITNELPPGGQFLLAFLMFLGRVGTITIATSLILGERRMPYRYPEEHPIVG